MNSEEVIEFSAYDASTIQLADLEEAGDATEEVEGPVEVKPTIDTKERELEMGLVEYPHTKRGPRDVVLSGPVIGGWGPGRYFRNRRLATRHFIDKYGHARVGMVGGATKGRWAVLIRNLRQDAA
jgi:hypothetical protein